MKRIPDPTEMKTKHTAEYILLALHDLGGHAQWKPLMDRAEEIAEPDMSEADKALMRYGEKGEHQRLAEPGYQGRTWKVWRGKAEIALGRLYRAGFLARSEAQEYTFTLKGSEWLAAVSTRRRCVEQFYGK